MKISKRVFILLLVMGVVGASLWLSFRSVKIIAIHQDGTYSAILVKDYPLTSKGRMDWWLENKGMLKEKYNIPRPDEDGQYHVTLWDFDEGYKEEGKYDRLCFDDMPPPINCIDKNKLMIVGHSQNNVTQITVGNEYYILQDNGRFVKRESN